MSRDRHATPLELAEFPVDDLRFGRKLEYAGRSLEVDEAEVVEIASRDPRILSARLDIVRPDEEVRVTGIRDAVEPRVKVDGGGQVFPGITNPVTPVGAGRTHRLSGMTLMTTAEYEGTIRTGTTAQRSAILDMWGPGAALTGFSRYPHLVLTLGLPPDLIEAEAHQAIQAAEYQVGVLPPSYDKQFGRDCLNSVDWDHEPPAPRLPESVIARTAEKYQTALELLTS